jgi:hypothetical protein
MTMRLHSPVVTVRDGYARLEASLESPRGPRTLWYEVDSSHADALAHDRLDGFAIPALLMAMEVGEGELVLDGRMSERLVYNLESQVAPMLRGIVSGLRDVSLRAPALDACTARRGTGVVTGFSAGIDSLCAVAEHLDPCDTPGYRLTHLVFCNVGSHGHGDRGRELFRQRWDLIRKFGDAVGLPIVRIDSNVDDLVATSFEQSHALRNASAVLTLQGLFGRYLYSSTYQFRDCHFRSSWDVAHADPALVPLLSTERFESVSTGCQYTRVEKTRIALRLPETRTTLNVCTVPRADGRNCSRCWKCLRTLVTLELLGELDGFGAVFDIERYRKSRERIEYLMLLPGRTEDPFIRELYEFAQTPAARVPRFASRFHAWWPAFDVPYRVARRLSSLGR